ncbi:MAG: flagellar motor switch protein FliG [Gemmatimonadaceae bacterium]
MARPNSPSIPPPRPLNGRQKAAILCLALGAEHAAALTQRLTAEEAELISLEIARMGRVDPDAAESVLVEWIELSMASEAIATGGVEYAREMLEKAFNVQKAENILRRVTNHLADAFGGLQRLRHADAKQIANMFRTEHPQTIALVIAHLATAQAAAVLRELEPAVGADVAYRMARMQKVSPDMIALIERSLGSDADLDLQSGTNAGGPAAVAAILNLLQGTLEKSILEVVADHDPELSERIKNLMFVFEDLRTIDDRALQRLLRDVDSKTLALALKGGSGELRQRITSQMSQRASAALAEEMEILGPTRMRDVEAAQAVIVAQARALEAAGELVLNGGGDDVVVG